MIAALVRKLTRWAWQSELDRLEEKALEWAESSDRYAEQLFNTEEAHNAVRESLKRDGLRGAWRTLTDQIAWLLVKRMGGEVVISWRDLPYDHRLVLDVDHLGLGPEIRLRSLTLLEMELKAQERK